MAEVLIGSMAMPVVQASALELSQITTSSAIEQSLKGETSTTAEGLKYEILSDGTGVEITGYTGTATEVIIPETIENLPVVEIGSSAFRECTSLTTINLPSGLISIAYNAFDLCNMLTAITVEEGNNIYSSVDGVLYNKDKTTIYRYPIGKNGTSYEILDTVKTINTGAFSGCSSLITINLPAGLTHIGELAFQDCSNLTSIVIPAEVSYISTSTAFSGCKSLTTITVQEENNVYSSVDGVLYNKDKTTIYNYPVSKSGNSYTILQSVTSIEYKAFNDCDNLTAIVLPTTVTSIGAWAFAECSNLTTISIPDGVTIIEPYTFYRCIGLTTINIPNGVTSIREGAFWNCSSLTTIEIPDGVTSIGTYAFSSCNNLTTIDLPDSVISIGYQVFSSCNNLTTINLPDSVTSIGTYAFSSCNNLTTINIPEGVTSIGDGVFHSCSNLTTIEIPNRVTNIGKDAFFNCDLVEVDIPSGVTSIGEDAFSDNINLNSINVDDKNENYISVDGVLYDKNMTTLLQFPPAKVADSYVIPNSVQKIGSFRYAKGLKELTISKNVKEYDIGAFFGCTGIENIILEEGLTVMPTLSAMTRLTEVVIPTTVTKLEGRIFEGCVNLEIVVIPKGVTYIDKNIFNYSNFEFEDEDGNKVPISNKAIIVCAEDSVAKQFAIDNNVRYLIKSTLPTILGVENNISYETAITPTASDENLKVVNLYKNGNIVSDYKNGDTVSERGIYKLVAKDIVGNETIVNFTIGSQLVKGDVTGDGKITATDILKIKKHIVGLEFLNDEQITSGDINEDGKITGTDLLKAKKKFVGLE